MAACLLTNRTIGGVLIDVVISEKAKSSMEIPKHPVEKGASISDHAYRNPHTIDIESVIDEARAITSYDALQRVMQAAEPFDFLYGFRLFQNMLISSLEPERTDEYGRVLKFTAELTEVVIVASQEGPATAGKAGGKGGDERGKATTQRGQVQARTVETPTGPRGEKILADLEAM